MGYPSLNNVLNTSVAINDAISGIADITTLTSVGGVVTVDLSTVGKICSLTMTEAVTQWVFNNRPATGKTQELTLIWQQHATLVYNCISPATKTAGGGWTSSVVPGAIDTLGLIIIDGTDIYVYPSSPLLS